MQRLGVTVARHQWLWMLRPACGWEGGYMWLAEWVRSRDNQRRLIGSHVLKTPFLLA